MEVPIRAARVERSVPGPSSLLLSAAWTRAETSALQDRTTSGSKRRTMSMSAPWSSKRSTTSQRLSSSATQSAFQQEGRATASGEAPRARRLLTMDMLPTATAYIRGVQPLPGSRCSTSAPCSRSSSTSPAWPRWIAAMSEGPASSKRRCPAAAPSALLICGLPHALQPERHRFGRQAHHARHFDASAVYISASCGWRLLMSFKSAPASSSISTNQPRLDMMATQRAFQSDGFAKEFTEAPCFSSSLTVGSSPLATAYMRGVQPLLGSRQSTAAPSSSSAATASACRRCAAIRRGGHPLASAACTTSSRLLSSEASPSR
mmetsp:Transcript_102372/g.315884  ORF Transcript_102372/g.315884 Transcript_102372/m.315884 type:complete len:319 (-) Transcript_102372:515-1471(-)